MARLFVDNDKYGGENAAAIVEAFNSAMRAMVREKWAASGHDWASFVFGASRAITAEDIDAVDRRVLELGYRFTWSAVVSAKERPDAYRDVPGGEGADADFSFEHPDATTTAPDAAGREQRGIGDNVARRPENTVGIARYVRTPDRVLQYLNDGVPPDTIAIIDDSGGTLTAPILEQFKGVLCAGGTVRSHLGILTREYGIPCFMNAKLAGLKEGDRVEMETTAAARSAEDYQQNVVRTACVWRLPA